MKKISLYIILPVFCVLFFYGFSIAQNINGFRIQVSKKAVTYFIFNATVTNWKFLDNDEGYSVYSIQNQGPTTVTISAKKETSQMYPLLITEGKRVHKFYITYKDDISESELEHDYSDLKNLKQLIKDEESKPKQEPAAVTEKPKEVITPAEKPKQEPEAPVNNNVPVSTNQPAVTKPVETENYNDVITEANKAFKAEKYDEAKALYSKALVIKPGDVWAASQMKKIDNFANTAKQSEDNRKTRELFQSFIDAGDKYFTQKSYEDAATAYKQALSVIPGDAVAQAKLKDAESKQKESVSLAENQKKLEEAKKKDDEYKSYISAGEKAFNENSYENAILSFNQALGVKPNDAYALQKINEINKRKELEKQNAEAKRVEVSYKSFMDIGDDNFKKEAFEDAREAYKEALKLKPNDATATKQLGKIDGAIAAYNTKIEKQKKDKEFDDRYNEVMNLANNAFEAGVYDVAREQYKKALQLKPNEPAPAKRLTETEGLISKQIEANNKRIKDSVTTLKYNDAIAKAEKAKDNKDYKNAIASYQLAASLKPDEQYPQQKVTEIQETIKAENERIAQERRIENQYNDAVQKGNSALKYNQLETAQKAFAEAARLKPGAEPAQSKLKEVTDKLAEIARQKEIDEKYEAAIHNGDSLASSEGGLEEALKWYKAANELKPEKELARKQVSYVEQRLGVDSISVAKKRKQAAIDAENDKLKAGLASFNKGNELIRTKNYEEALSAFNAFLSTSIDTSVLNPKSYKIQYQFARDKVKDLQDYLERTKKPEPPPVVVQEDTNKGKKKKKKVKEEKKAVAEDESKSMTVIYFPTQKDIDIKAMKAKYPGIDFNAAPPEQMFNSQEYSKQKTKDVQEVLEQSPNLSIAGTGGDVALTCTGISFKGDDAFLKFSIENKSGTDFLTGPMLLTRNGKEGRSITLYPVYISEFPIILPGKEKTIVYATNAIADMSADENFALELNDRFKKTKASVTIPGAIYNKEKQH